MSAKPEENLTPEQIAKREAKKKAKEEQKRQKLEKLRLKQEARAKEAERLAAKKKEAPGHDTTGGDGKKKLRLREKFVNPTPKGEKKDMTGPMAEAYNPPAVEAAWYDWWEACGFFKPSPERREADRPVYCIVIPPPNVTGALHIGHALTGSVQDALVRWRRMSGDDVLWVPGMDHAGIATQRVVEGMLARQENVHRRDLGREKFVERVWEWKEKFGGRITTQQRRMGISVDWSREVFTMDERLSRAVVECFVRFFDDGLVHRANRLVNYCCALETAISDIEVDYIDVPGRTMLKVPGTEQKIEFGVLTEFAYKVLDEATGEPTDDELVVATTRPETMLGDTAVAVHPEDPRYTRFHGKRLHHPFVADREVRVVTDSTLVKMEFGTGAVKVTPAHDPNDWECGQRHGLAAINILAKDGTLNEHAGPRFQGQHRLEARELVVQALKDAGLFRGTKENEMRLGLCSRTKDVIEPCLSPQWYVRCKEMGEEASKAVRDGRLEILPAMHRDTWHRWLDDSRDWCVSRQLWWGHQIPAYLVSVRGEQKPAMETSSWVAAQSEAEARQKAARQFGVPEADITALDRDPDVLDTWFSSGLFPFSALGWPETTPDLERYFPNSVLETGHDILFFWVARMVMMSQRLTGRLPFSKVLLHAMVRDAHNRKMSKSKGNVIDPIDVIEGITLEDLHKSLEGGNLPAHEIELARKGQSADFPNGITECGTDALRYGLCDYTVQGRSINLDVNRVAAYRNFCNKLWQATRFALARLDDDGKQQYKPKPAAPLPAGASDPWAAAPVNPLPESALAIERWLMSRLHACTAAVDEGMRSFNLGAATGALRQFLLHELCDVFLEACKPVFYSGYAPPGSGAGANDTAVAGLRETLYTALDLGLKLLHPFMPFVTEELWHRLARRPGELTDPKSIMVSVFPQAEPMRAAGWVNAAAEESGERATAVVAAIRSLRTQYHMAPSKRPAVIIRAVDAEQAQGDWPMLHHLVPTLAETAPDPRLDVTEGAASQPPPDGYVATGVPSAGVAVCLEVRGMVDCAAEIKRVTKQLAQKEKALEKLVAKMAGAHYKQKVPEQVQEKDLGNKAAFELEIVNLRETIAQLEKLS